VFYPTIEDTYEAYVDTDRGVKEMVRFYDLGGITSKSREVPRHYFNLVDAYILLYSIASHESFIIMDALKKDIERNREKKDALIIVLGNKLDLVEERQVDYSQASAWANKERVRLFEVLVHLNPFLKEATLLFKTINSVHDSRFQCLITKH
jgi:NF-kappa-B inhibitor-interacting Ras-like protein